MVCWRIVLQSPSGGHTQRYCQPVQTAASLQTLHRSLLMPRGVYTDDTCAIIISESQQHHRFSFIRLGFFKLIIYRLCFVRPTCSRQLTAQILIFTHGSVGDFVCLGFFLPKGTRERRFHVLSEHLNTNKLQWRSNNPHLFTSCVSQTFLSSHQIRSKSDTRSILLRLLSVGTEWRGYLHFYQK